MINVSDLTFRYRSSFRYAIYSASCSTESEGTTAIVGQSGAGKSTLMALLSGMYTLQDEIVECMEGTVTLDGQQPQRLRGPRTVSWVPQQPALFDHFTVFQNVILPLTILGNVNKDGLAEGERLIARLGLTDYVNARPRELSGGMRTRVSIARALISRPNYLFLDEPFVSLDIANRWALYRLLQDERAGSEFRTVITTHDIPEAILLSNRILVVGCGDPITSIEVINNQPIDISSDDTFVHLKEARTRAPAIEAKIYL